MTLCAEKKKKKKKKKKKAHDRPATTEEANLKCVPPFGIHSKSSAGIHSQVRKR